MRYTVKWSEKKKEGNTNGRDWVITNMTLEDEEGKAYENVSTFATVMSGGTIEGEIVKKGDYLNFVPKLEKPNFMKAKEATIEKAMDKKNESIAHFQDKKEESIALAGAQRDAVLIVSTMLGSSEYVDKPMNRDEIKAYILHWRNWFLSEEFRLPPPF